MRPDLLCTIAAGDVVLPGIDNDPLLPQFDPAEIGTVLAHETGLPSIAPPCLTELDALQLTPGIVLPGLLYKDVRCRIAAGGVGKTTLALFEAVSLALERELWGRRPDRHVMTLFITREDGRDTLLARLREVMRAMGLTDEERVTVLDRVRILDLSATPFRLSVVASDVVMPNVTGIDSIIELLDAESFKPDWVILDPAVSFGVGESRVNDAEQGLIEAARIIRNRLDCCVEYIHHTGKQVARDKILDQYAGRGGSSFADGARMVAVMQPLTPAEWLKETGTALDDGWQGLVMALPKLSYTKPQAPIFIRRHGFTFEQAQVVKADPEREREAVANQVWQFLKSEAEKMRRYSGKDLNNSRDQLNLSKHQIESALSRLKVSGRVVVVGSAGTKQVLEAIDITPEPSPATSGKGSDKSAFLGDDE